MTINDTACVVTLIDTRLVEDGFEHIDNLVTLGHGEREGVGRHVCQAYVLWKTLGQLCQSAGLGNEPRRVLAELSDIRLVDVVLPTRSGIEIRRRCVSRPSDHQQTLLFDPLLGKLG